MQEVIFNGRRYHKRHNGYWKSGQLWLHREVWKNTHGDIPPKHVIHHKDGDRDNNTLENLELLSFTEHSARHPNVEAWRKNIAKACEAARHCDYRKNHEAMSKASKKGWEKIPFYKHTCQLCGEEFLSRGKHSKYCSTKCKNTARLHPDRIIKVEKLGEEEVYNLTTDSHNYVLGNGAVVHNCDAMRYIVKTKINMRRILQ